eukprot:3994772-Amphidinium_carterae.2
MLMFQRKVQELQDAASRPPVKKVKLSMVVVHATEEQPTADQIASIKFVVGLRGPTEETQDVGLRD